MRTSKQYAPVWMMLFSTATAVARKVGERYLLQKEWELSWKDLQTAAVGAVVGYVLFRSRHGNKKQGLLTR